MTKYIIVYKSMRNTDIVNATMIMAEDIKTASIKFYNSNTNKSIIKVFEYEEER